MQGDLKKEQLRCGFNYAVPKKGKQDKRKILNHGNGTDLEAAKATGQI